jgi:hypothetical protein
LLKENFTAKSCKNHVWIITFDSLKKVVLCTFGGGIGIGRKIQPTHQR